MNRLTTRISRLFDEPEDREIDAVFRPAVLFLSMASTRGVQRGDDGTPIAISVQREAGYRRAIHLGIGIVQEFVELHTSARDYTKRPVLQGMLAYLSEHTEVKNAIFPGPHRFSRSITDVLLLQQQFDRLGVAVAFADGTPTHMNTSPDRVTVALKPDG